MDLLVVAKKKAGVQCLTHTTKVPCGFEFENTDLQIKVIFH